MRGNTTLRLSENISIELDNNGMELKTTPFIECMDTDVANWIVRPAEWAREMLVDIMRRKGDEAARAEKDARAAEQLLAELNAANPPQEARP